ncbi:hypothetical protein SAMN04515674_105303 [Pseudarcicella hirudinis]|uniref:Uncharacterized protein n=1 Tax=Pseudarcicella hirudinis TaxID=1079859 RepID=A0A1I5T084_9BACT|nr:hypothetical protein [Pseudarcicella hirudinis]SFP76378.1 hypothetical protein SAMN04515674_105303 [Pseudarcicella hirudinis]
MKKYKVRVVKDLEMEFEFDEQYWTAEKLAECADENGFSGDIFKCMAEHVAISVFERISEEMEIGVSVKSEDKGEMKADGALFKITALSYESETREC